MLNLNTNLKMKNLPKIEVINFISLRLNFNGKLFDC